MYSIVRHAAVVGSLVTVTAFQSIEAHAQNPRDVQITAEKVRDNVYVLFGQGGNIGLSIGEDGAFMIDDQFAPLTGKILEAVGKLTDEPVKFLINTHWHGDHTGGNENLGKEGAIIVAHENVRKLMSTDQFMKAFNQTVPAAPREALPVITFADSINFHWNGDDIHVFHVKPAHTDGDSIIHFAKANVYHMGDIYFSSGYPFIDADHSGNIDGMVAACDSVLAHANAEARLIPGHGPVTGVAELTEYRNMLKHVSDSVHKLIDAGKSRDEVIAAKPTAAFDAKWGQSFMQPDAWAGIVYDGIVNMKKVQAETEHGHEGS